MTHQNTFSRTALAAALFAGLCVVATAQTTKPRTAEPSAPDKTAIEAAFMRADANRDGVLSRDEAARMPAIAAKFDELDKNKDALLSPEEFAAGATVKAK